MLFYRSEVEEVSPGQWVLLYEKRFYEPNDTFKVQIHTIEILLQNI